ncbi:MAG: transposase [Clostridia bacterium]|nr:transposase [Clostridia bacterium]
MNESTIKFIISRVIENDKDAAEEAKQNKADDFYKGRKMAYYEILDTIKNEMDVRDADLKQLGLDIDLEKEFL